MPFSIIQPMRCRRGISVLESLIALSLLALGVVFTAQVFLLCACERMAGEQLLAAQWEATNVLEHLEGLSYEALTPEAASDVHPSSQLQSALPSAKLKVTVIPSNAADSSSAKATATEAPAAASANSAGEPTHKRIQVEVTWPAVEGPAHSVKLTAWKYPEVAEAAP